MECGCGRLAGAPHSALTIAIHQSSTYPETGPASLVPQRWGANQTELLPRCPKPRLVRGFWLFGPVMDLWVS
jgi:hypothetical protein